MFSSRTLTRGSPRNPTVLPEVCFVTSERTVASGTFLADATRASWIAAYWGEMYGSSPDPRS